MRGLAAKLAGAAIAALALLGLVAWRLGASGDAPGTMRVFTVPEGASRSEVAAALAEEGAVSSSLVAHLAFALALAEPEPGRHLVPGDASARLVARLLAREPGRPTAKVTLPEGLHRKQLAERLEAAGVVDRESFLAATVAPRLLASLPIARGAARVPESAEGFLFPATYEFPLDARAEEVVARLVREWMTRYARLVDKHAEGAKKLEATLGWGPFEIATLAAMVEEEAAVAEERPVIAQVFLNRLVREDFTPRLLQSDPTSAYACAFEPERAPGCASFAGKPTPETNRDPQNRYSTYTNEGLPPGPITNPGEGALAAVLAPSDTRALYFVARGGGRHVFSDTYEEHRRAIEQQRGRP